MQQAQGIKRPYTSKYQKYYKEWARLYLQGVKLNDIAKTYGCAPATIHNALNRLNVKRFNKKHTYFYDEWCELYESGKSTVEIAKMYNVYHENVNYALRKRGVAIRNPSIAGMKNEINEHYFDTIDTDEKAYWLGFIAADGCISTNGNGYKIIICLNKKDIDMLVAFKNAINSTRDIKMIGRSKAEFRCNSKYMVNALKKYGITPRKTFTMEFSNEIPSKYYSGFIRGYFDGDGTIYFSKEGKPYWGIVATKAFLEKVQEIIMDEVGLSKTKIRKKGKMYELRYIGSNNVKAIREWLYKDATVYMNRKKERMDSIK